MKLKLTGDDVKLIQETLDPVLSLLVTAVMYKRDMAKSSENVIEITNLICDHISEYCGGGE